MSSLVDTAGSRRARITQGQTKNPQMYFYKMGFRKVKQLNVVRYQILSCEKQCFDTGFPRNGRNHQLKHEFRVQRTVILFRYSEGVTPLISRKALLKGVIDW